ncbi:MAG: uracil-DNA glycosylase [Nevskiaceae bacterium]|nr:MAG: uracil-DNA glycosylase [Nevskiaceae bacterium]TBR74675.1 MAG: uracil-DNA glycosylase [Nevskiaceae bacterium]
MQTDSRARALDALGIRRWTRRGLAVAPAPAEQVAPPAVASPIVTQSVAASKLQIPLPPKPQIPVSEPMAAPPEIPYEAPRDWAGLRAAVAGCRRCRLCETRHNTVFGVGPEHAPLMVVGEGPGADEDAKGEPFVGRAGRLLDEMLRAIGCSRTENVFVANVVKCRPPMNRDPRPEEVAACRPYLDRQIELIQPRLIVGLGRVAAQRLLGTDAPMFKLRGTLHHYGARHTPVMLTYHPAYLLRTPREKAKAWDDLKAIARFLRQDGGDSP